LNAISAIPRANFSQSPFPALCNKMNNTQSSFLI
jgi:hypothetical protein